MDLEKSNYEAYKKSGSIVDIYPDANKALCVIFIVLILVVNLLLMIKFMKKGNVLFNPKSLTIISMAIGDVFLALFALTLKAEVFFKGFDSLSCGSIRSSWAYTNYLLNFVYGMGLITLAAEIVYRRKTQGNSRTKVFRLVSSLLFSSAPWVLGVVIILPLVLVNIDSVTCQSHRTHDQIKAQIMVSIMLPAIAAVLTSIVLKCQVQNTDKNTFRTLPNRKGDLRAKALEFHTSPAASRTTRNKRFNAKEIFALDHDLRSRGVFATKMSATTPALQPTAPTQPLQPTAPTPNRNSFLRQYSRIQSAKTPKFVLTDGQYVIHAQQPEDNGSPQLTQSNIFQPGFVNPAFQQDHIDTRSQYNSTHEQSQMEIVYPNVHHSYEVIPGSQNTQVVTLVPLSTSDRISEEDQYRIEHLKQYPVQTHAQTNSQHPLYPIIPQQNSKEPHYPILLQSNSQQSPYPTRPHPNSQQHPYPTLPHPNSQQHPYQMVPQQTIPLPPNIVQQSHNQQLQHYSLPQADSQLVPIAVQTQPSSQLSSNQVAVQAEFHPTVTSPPVHQYSQHHLLKPVDIVLEHDGRQMAPYPITTVPQQNGQAAPYPINSVQQQNGQQVASYPITTVPQQSGQVAPYPINAVPQHNGQVAPYPINTVPQQSGQVAPYPINAVPQQNSQEAPYPINTLQQQNGQMAHYLINTVQQPNPQVPPYPTNTAQQQNSQVAHYPINTVPQQNGQVAPYPINTVPQQNGQVVPYPTNTVQQQNSPVAPYPINTVPQQNFHVAPYPINTVTQDNGPVASYPCNTVPQENGPVAPYLINNVPQQNGQETPYPINTAQQQNGQVANYSINTVPQQNGQVAHYPRNTAQERIKLPNSTNIKHNRRAAQVARNPNDKAIPPVQNQVGNSEKSHLLANSLFFFLLVMPFAIFDISQPEMAVTTLLIVKEIVTWLMVSRSVVTPCIMYFYAGN